MTADHIAFGIFANATPILCPKFHSTTHIFLNQENK
nr:MAG TPA: hypothetical protein [Caudoviricetes sp.]